MYWVCRVHVSGVLPFKCIIYMLGTRERGVTAGSVVGCEYIHGICCMSHQGGRGSAENPVRAACVCACTHIDLASCSHPFDRNFGLLSFGDEAEEDDEDAEQFVAHTGTHSSHDLLNDPRFVTTTRDDLLLHGVCPLQELFFSAD